MAQQPSWGLDPVEATIGRGRCAVTFLPPGTCWDRQGVRSVNTEGDAERDMFVAVHSASGLPALYDCCGHPIGVACCPAAEPEAFQRWRGGRRRRPTSASIPEDGTIPEASEEMWANRTESRRKEIQTLTQIIGKKATASSSQAVDAVASHIERAPDPEDPTLQSRRAWKRTVEQWFKAVLLDACGPAARDSVDAPAQE